MAAQFQGVRHTRRHVTLRPDSMEELISLVVDRSRGMFWLRTRASFRQEEPVLLDLALPWCGAEQRCMLRAFARYSIPEGRGPMFACDPRDLPTLNFILSQGRLQPRAHVRYPVAMHAAVRTGESMRRATLADVSQAGARLELDRPFERGTILSLELPALSRQLMARVVGERDGLSVVQFTGQDSSGWRELRRALRRSHETGRWRLPC